MEIDETALFRLFGGHTPKTAHDPTDQRSKTVQETLDSGSAPRHDPSRRQGPGASVSFSAAVPPPTAPLGHHAPPAEASSLGDGLGLAVGALWLLAALLA